MSHQGRAWGAARRALLSCALLGVLLSVAGALRAEEKVAAGSRYRIAYATYLGGSAWDQAREIIVSPGGSVLVGLKSSSAGMPTTRGVIQPRYAGDDPSLGHPGVYGGDCYLARLSADGKRLLAATYFGGSRQERNVYGMERDQRGNIVITTMTRSDDMPATSGAVQRKYGGGPSDMVVAKISPDLKKLLWCTYVGGKGDDSPRGGLALDPSGAVCIVGTSTSSDFPATKRAYQGSLKGPRDSVVLKLAPDGSALVASTFLGGSAEDHAAMGARLGSKGEVYLAGHTRSRDFPVTRDAPQPKLGGESDVYFACLASDLSELLYATYLGGGSNEFAEHRILLGEWDTVYLAGFTASRDFPVTDWAYQRHLKGKGDGFVAKLSRDGDSFLILTLLGGSGTENWLMPTLDASGNIYVVGETDSEDFPVTADALQPRRGGGKDGALAVLTPDGSDLLYATYLGGSGDEVVRSLAFGPEGDVYLVGSTTSEDFPVTAGAVQTRYGGQGDAFVARLAGLPRFPRGKWVSLSDGKTLSQWRPFQDTQYPDMFGKVRVEEGTIFLEAGEPMTGVTWTGNVPRDSYEIALEGMRVKGGDFFCGLTFPVGDSFLTLILGGWGGAVVGLSNIDTYSAVENETTTSMDFESKRWYAIRVRVTPETIRVWIDGKRKIDVNRAGHEFSIWPQQEPGRPLGITSYYTKAALRNIRVKALAPDS